MADAIAPALSAEEWEKAKDARFAWRMFGWDDGAGAILHDDGRLEVNWDGAVYDQEMQCVTTSRHALAALALHGQPFGFTREDVRFLRDVDVFAFTEDAQMAQSIAARIAALLPPEGA